MDDYIRKHGPIKGDLQRPVAPFALWKDLAKVKVTAGDLTYSIGNLYTPNGTHVWLRTLWRLCSTDYLTLWGNGLDDDDYTINDAHVQLDTVPKLWAKR